MEEKIVVTSVEDYRNTVQKEQTVTLPSGAIFTIRKINTRELLKTGKIPLLSADDFTSTSEEKKKILASKMTQEERKSVLEYNDKIIVLGVVQPQMSLERVEGKLHIEDLTDADYYFLLNSIIKGGEDLKSFRQ